MMPQANQGAPGPFQSGHSTFPNHLRTSDQGFVMGGVNQSTHSERSSGGESNVSHAAVLAHAEREVCTKELLGYNTGGYKAMSGTVQRTSCDETPRDDDVMSEKEGSEQLGLFAAMSNRCPMWILFHIKSADVFPLCSLERQENTRQFIALAASIFNERKEQGEEVQTPDMKVFEKVVEGKGQCFILSRCDLANDTSSAPLVRRLFLNHVLEHRETANIDLCDAERTMRLEYPSLDLSRRDSIATFSRRYIQGEFNSGFAEMLYFAQMDQCDYLVCSVLQDVTPTGDRANYGLLVPVAYVPCLDGTKTKRPLKLLKAGVVSEEQATLRWIMFEHGAIANPAALEQITHFNVLRTMTMGERAQGIQHIIVTTVPQSYTTIELGSNSEVAEASVEIHNVKASVEIHNVTDDQGKESQVIEQIVRDRLALTQSNLLRLVVSDWSQTARELTKVTHFRLEHRLAQLTRSRSIYFDTLKLVCTVLKRIALGQQMLQRIYRELIKSVTIDKWIRAKHLQYQVMSKQERKSASSALRQRSTERYRRELVLHSFGLWVYFLPNATTSKLSRSERRTTRMQWLGRNGSQSYG